MVLDFNLTAMERAREQYWLRYADTSPLKLHWRALTVRHSLPMKLRAPARFPKLRAGEPASIILQ